MPVSPHPITVTVYDVDNTSLKEGAKVYIRNATKKTNSAEAATNSSGVAIIDLANMPIGTGQTSQYDAGDVTLIIVYDKENHDAAYYVVTGVSKSQTLYLNPIPHNKGFAKEFLTSFVVANTNASTAYYAKMYNCNDGRLLSAVVCPASNTQEVHGGIKTAGGIVCVRQNKDLLCTVNIK